MPLTTGPAHFPLLKPQQPAAQSASELHTPVMNCAPGAFPDPVVGGLLGEGGSGLVGLAAGGSGAVAGIWDPAFASASAAPFKALLFGCASPKPHPSPLSFATKGATQHIS